MTDNHPDIFDEYQNILGHAKMQKLWLMFKDDANKCLNLNPTKDKDTLRLHFHSLRSSALVFGMKDFSAGCATIEEILINGAGEPELAKEIEKVKLIFNRERQIVSAHL